MNRDTLETVYDYFAAIQEKSEEESHILGLLTGELPYFPITSISRDDLKQRGFDISRISDDEMIELAGKMEDRYIPKSFWQDMDEFAADMQLPVIPDAVPCPECDSYDSETIPVTGTHICNTCEHKW